ncbi:MAG: chemotaxis protein CheW [Vicinamibacterales bacterium]
MNEQSELVKEFLIESHENLDRLDRTLVDLEKDPRDRDKLAEIFRTIHTIKGTCGFLGYSKLESVSHVGENLLSRLRDGEITLDAPRTTALLRMIDAIREILAAIEETADEGDGDYDALVDELVRVNGRYEDGGAPAGSSLAEGSAAPAATEDPALSTRQVEPVSAQPSQAESDRRGGDDRRTNEDRRQAPAPGHALADSSLRVDVGLLDKLMNLVGELVLARNQILQFKATQTDSGFLGASQRLNLVTSELQESVMKTRMQPIGNIWSKFPRVVRDLATACGKQVRLEMHGRETDLDKTIIEAIKDPLTHVVRNSVDHGIEFPAARLAAGKNPEGVLTLRAFHEGGQINIEISDDGGGIDPEKVRAKAVQRGIVAAEQAARLTDHEVLKLIFLPGFSTAEKITNVSGRGVGMDVVKTNIEKIGGTVDIHSKAGEGTTLRVKIPLTLAIIPALMVTTGGERFAIPQVSLVELVRLEGAQVSAGVERIGGSTFYRLRGNLLPLVYLHRELELEPAGPADVVNVVVLKADGRQFGLVVDAINDTEEIVVKPLGKQLKLVKVFAGATIMGDGCVALILDVLGLAQQAAVVSAMREAGAGDAEAAPAKGQGGGEQRTLLVFHVGDQERMALPLSMVARLEEFSPAMIERSGGRDVVQYRDEILPLICLSSYFGLSETSGDAPRQVIVFSRNGRSVGLVVNEILDIVTEAVSITERTSRRGVLGAAILQQKVTDVLDVHAVIQDLDPTLVESEAA